MPLLFSQNSIEMLLYSYNSDTCTQLYLWKCTGDMKCNIRRAQTAKAASQNHNKQKGEYSVHVTKVISCLQ